MQGTFIHQRAPDHEDNQLRAVDINVAHNCAGVVVYALNNNFAKLKQLKELICVKMYQVQG